MKNSIIPFILSTIDSASAVFIFGGYHIAFFIDMGNYINKGNDGFTSVCNSDFIDKSMLVEQVNSVLNTENRYMCVTRARRFGKSVAVKMLNAYYDQSCDSASLFDNLAIKGCADFDKHRNHYPVIYCDMTDFITKYGDDKHLLKVISQYSILFTETR